MHVWGITVATASPNDKFNKFLCLPLNKINIIYHYNETALMQTCIVPLPRQEPGHSSVCQFVYSLSVSKIIQKLNLMRHSGEVEHEERNI